MAAFVFALSLLHVLSLPIVFGHILRLPCTSYGNFSIEKEDHELMGHTLGEFRNLDVNKCEQKCVQHPLCKSINMKNATGINCKINSKSTEDQFEVVAVSPSPGWSYKTTDYEERNIGRQCQTTKPCPEDNVCIDSCTCPGFQCHQSLVGNASDCQVLSQRGNRKSQVYTIYQPDTNNLDVFCDMETDENGWIVIQRRVNAAVDFQRDWITYKNGFGDPNGNFWLGLEKLHKLAGPGKGAVLRVDMKRIDKEKRNFAIYGIFEVAGEADKYRLHIGKYSGNAGDSLSQHNNFPFSTFDQDNDAWKHNCAKDLSRGGWWFRVCLNSNFNALYPINNVHEQKYMTWYSIAEKYGGVAFSEMKIRYS